MSSTTFDEQLGFPTANHKRICKLIMDIIPNDQKHLLRTETSLWKTFYWSNKDTRKVKDFQKLSNKEIYCTPHFNSTKCNKLLEFISWPNFLEGHHILCPKIWGENVTD